MLRVVSVTARVSLPLCVLNGCAYRVVPLSGVAFTNLRGPVYAACSMTATGASCRLRLEG